MNDSRRYKCDCSTIKDYSNDINYSGFGYLLIEGTVFTSHSVYKDSFEEGSSRDWCTCDCRGNRLGSGLVPRWSINLYEIAKSQPKMAE